MARYISNSDDVIDSRDVIKRINDLESEEDSLEQDDLDELKALRELEEEAAGYSPDWIHGEVLVRDSYFEEYAKQLADDIGAIDRNARWPLDCIDWEKAARELQVDYTSVDYGGVTYWIRCG